MQESKYNYFKSYGLKLTGIKIICDPKAYASRDIHISIKFLDQRLIRFPRSVSASCNDFD